MLCGLTVLHHRKDSGLPIAVPPLPANSGPALVLDTCQRWICVLHTQHPVPTTAEVEQFREEDAYRFLLRVTTGLESRLQGETNIFGQVKQAWAAHGPQFPWIQRLFEDTREIRARNLSTVGGPSYGRLVRRAMQSERIPVGAHVLLVGAGELARTVAPWLTGFKLRILNRDLTRAEALADFLRRQNQDRSSITTVDPADARDAWRTTSAIVLCIPFDPDADAARIEHIQDRAESSAPVPFVLHLGGSRNQAGPWTRLPRFQSLDGLFVMARLESCARTAHLRRASQACAERARLRALGPSLSIHHGWEDLASFSGWESGSSAEPDTTAENQYTPGVAAHLALH
ncbi:MAG: hypothetical protein AB7O66_10570 [Limisphaerales bacterium]